MTENTCLMVHSQVVSSTMMEARALNRDLREGRKALEPYWRQGHPNQHFEFLAFHGIIFHDHNDDDEQIRLKCL